MGWASMYHVTKIYYLCLLFWHVTIINILSYLLTYNVAPMQGRKQSNTKLNHYAMGTRNRL